MLSNSRDIERYYAPAILAFAFLLFFPGLAARDLWAPVEPRYAEIVRVMFGSGEWIVPRINGELYTDKPILFFWIALSAAKIQGGVNEWAVRLPAALGGIGFVLGTYFFGREFFNARIGAIAAIVVATSSGVIWESRWAHVDMLFCAFFLLSIYFGARTLMRRGGPNEILLAYVFMALATLTKGLIGVVLPSFLFGSFMLLRRDRDLLRQAKPVLGAAIFLLIAGPWFVIVHRATDGQWLNDFIYVHHFLRYTEGNGHRRPFYYYFMTLPADFLPWTPLAVAATVTRPYREALSRPHVQFCVLWFLTVFVFFSLSDTKRELYLLPLMPTLALLVAAYVESPSDGPGRSKLPRYGMAGFFALVAALGLLAPVIVWLRWPDALWPCFPIALLLIAGGSLAATRLLHGRLLSAAAFIAAMMLFLTFAMVLGLFPYLEHYKSDREFAGEIERIVPRHATLYVYRDNMHDFNFYTKRAVIPVLKSAEQIAELRNRPSTSYVLIRERDWNKSLHLLSEWSVAATDGMDWRLIARRPSG